MNDTRAVDILNDRFEHIDTKESADDFCVNYGIGIEEICKTIEQKESWRCFKTRLWIMIVITFFSFILALLTVDNHPTLSLLFGIYAMILFVLISGFLRALLAIKKKKKRIEQFKTLKMVEGLSEAEAIQFVNDIIDQHNSNLDQGFTLFNLYTDYYQEASNNSNIFFNLALGAVPLLIIIVIVFMM